VSRAVGNLDVTVNPDAKEAAKIVDLGWTETSEMRRDGVQARLGAQRIAVLHLSQRIGRRFHGSAQGVAEIGQGIELGAMTLMALVTLAAFMEASVAVNGSCPQWKQSSRSRSPD
jgi:hypothetical protein